MVYTPYICTYDSVDITLPSVLGALDSQDQVDIQW